MTPRARRVYLALFAAACLIGVVLGDQFYSAVR